MRKEAIAASSGRGGVLGLILAVNPRRNVPRSFHGPRHPGRHPSSAGIPNGRDDTDGSGAFRANVRARVRAPECADHSKHHLVRQLSHPLWFELE